MHANRQYAVLMLVTLVVVASMFVLHGLSFEDAIEPQRSFNPPKFKNVSRLLPAATRTPEAMRQEACSTSRSLNASTRQAQTTFNAHCVCPEGFDVNEIQAQECKFSSMASLQEGESLTMLCPLSSACAQAAVEIDEGLFGRISDMPLENGDVVVDIGASLGFFSITLARRFPNVQIFAYEVNPVTFAFLKKNIQANGVAHQVYATNRGLSKDGHGLLQTVTFRDVVHSIRRYRLSSPVEKRKLQAAGNLAAMAGAIRLMKVDCGGCEYDILQEVCAFFPSQASQINRAIYVVGECHLSDSTSQKYIDGCKSIIRKAKGHALTRPKFGFLTETCQHFRA
eukprot:gnl/MRDRNA2_/MRDRNA2_63103_c0_seq1.p1 gnl/MRDRNA2_/MRDRNA2_63103_c0~~gnl/MRDRNA2_/MRDRNA2_63103_c0_seq1.p1  ORF type:complete len:339 (+),score=33.12 gnl/MRDRNA2_/MRDRNA2_63103_c0_seq1:207-1223(+)